MPTWTPSVWGRRLTFAGDWLISLEGRKLVVDSREGRFETTLGSTRPLDVLSGIFWSRVRFREKNGPANIDGIPNAEAQGLLDAVNAIVATNKRVEDLKEEKRRQQEFRRVFLSGVERWVSLATEHRSTMDQHNKCRWWIPYEVTQALILGQQTLAADAATIQRGLQDPGLRDALGDRLELVEHAYALHETDLPKLLSSRNRTLKTTEQTDCAELFDSLERQPLTAEQREAVLTFENRVQVVASAGSGKTSTMVARAIYALHRGYVQADEIVMLAFNDAAAKELQERVNAAARRTGISADGISAMTFHKLGLHIIGHGTGRAKRVPAWVTTDNGAAKLAEIIDALKDGDASFRMRFDLFRIVFGRALAPFGAKVDPEDFERNPGSGYRTGFRTLSGDIVKSQEERMIADWLFYNGVHFEYESSYEHPTTTATHAQYKPDFFFPDIGVYFEHYALNKNGQPPKEFVGYLDGVQWKRQLHKQFGTTCLETTSWGIRTGADFARLDAELTARGVVLDPNPDRPTRGDPPIDEPGLVRLFRTAICHAKSNALTMDQIRSRIGTSGDDGYRATMFLDLLEPIWERWDSALHEEEGVDFDDMLVQAALLMEGGAWKSPYRLVLADEFQDASQARARITQALVNRPGCFLFTVGDDWQSINRFAGADVSVMTGFKDRYRGAEVMNLTETFRSPQALCDAAATFIMKNPVQLKKQVRSRVPQEGPVIQAYQLNDRNQIRSAIQHHLHSIAADIAQGEVPTGRNGRTSVLVLGRYNKDRDYVPGFIPGSLDVEFMTIHRSKGLEADYVVLPNLARKGFPSYREDDLLLRLVMPTSDAFQFSEERRLFYVALTRARRSVIVFTVKGRNSEFLLELVEQEAVDVVDAGGEPSELVVCEVCKKGEMVERISQYGPWLACSNYPACENKRNIGGH